MKKLVIAVAISATTLLLIIAGAGEAGAAARTETPRPRPTHEMAIDRRAELAAILTVLDRTIADPIVRKRAAEKLVKLNDRQIELIASLADRAAVDGDGPAAGIALLLITALLILS